MLSKPNLKQTVVNRLIVYSHNLSIETVMEYLRYGELSRIGAL